jgi:hypothetical protein
MNTFPEELHSHGWAVRRLLLFIRSASPYWEESVHSFFQTKLEFSPSALEVEVSPEDYDVFKSPINPVDLTL